ncbi:MAG: DUF502 domain-containing protein [Phycisphaerales bacterium]|nr:DUF502 domain-containing protein [Phycisphaerales bacterium]
MTPKPSPSPSASKQKRTFGADFRLFFLRGLAILLPSVLTIWLLVAAYGFVQRTVAEPINRGLRQAVIQIAPRTVAPDRLPDWFSVPDNKVDAARLERARLGLRPLPDTLLRAQIRERNFADWWNSHWYLRNIGLLVAIVLFYLAGILLGGFLGRQMYGRVERFITRLPLIKQVYPSVKQVTEFLLGEKNQLSFNRVVIVEYPRRGIWTVGFHTGNTLRTVNRAAGVECVSVFIPSSPTPFTGYAINLPKDEVIDVDMTVEEALRFVISGGVLVPESQKDHHPPSLAGALAAQPGTAMMEGRTPARGGAEEDPTLSEARS